MATVSSPYDTSLYRPNVAVRQRLRDAFYGVGVLSVVFGLGMLGALLVDVVRDGVPWLDFQFVFSLNSSIPQNAGVVGAIVGSIYIVVITMATALPLGIASAIYLEEYAPKTWLTRIIEINIQNLAGVPSIVFGILGLQVFAQFFGFGGLGRSVLSAGLTMALLVLPLVIVSAREAIRAVPPSMREASLALGASKWQTTRNHVLPYALSGILTGSILAASTAMGETAPLVVIGVVSFAPFIPWSPFDTFSSLPSQIYTWVRNPDPEYLGLAAAAIIVLLVLLLMFNATAIYLRQRFRSRY